MQSDAVNPISVHISALHIQKSPSCVAVMMISPKSMQKTMVFSGTSVEMFLYCSHCHLALNRWYENVCRSFCRASTKPSNDKGALLSTLARRVSDPVLTFSQ